MRHTGDKYILKFVRPNHRVIVENGSSCYVPSQDIISDIIKGLLSGFVLIHVEGIVDLSCKDTLSPGLNGVDWR